MASRQAESMAVVRRAEKLADMGWRVEKAAGDGWYKVSNPEGHTINIHMTYSDRNSLTAALRDLDSAGFSAAERELKQQRAKDRARKIKEDREAAERKAEMLAARSVASVSKAAGPYLTEPEECDLAWLTEKHPAPWMRWMYVTAKAAAHLLEHCNSDNRPISEDQSSRYASIILSKQWHLTHQGLAFDTRGLVQDAQHRLRGIVIASDAEEDIKVPFAVFVGMPPENFTAIDEGRLRTAAQMLAAHQVPNATVLTGVMRLVDAYESDDGRRYARQSGRYTQARAFKRFESDPRGLQDAVKYGARAYKQSMHLLPRYAMGAAYYLVGQANGFDNPYVIAFFEGLVSDRKYGTDYGLPYDDPRTALRTRCRTRTKASTNVDTVGAIITAWNLVAQDHFVAALKFLPTTPLPQPVVCKPGSAAVPQALIGEIPREEQQ